jgi:hypothetical protein
MLFTLRIQLLAAAVTGIATTSASAATIVGYDFSQSPANNGDPLPPSSSPPANVTASSIDNGNGITGNWRSASNAGSFFVTTSQLNATTPASDDYLTFTVTPDSGYRLDLTRLDFTTVATASTQTPSLDFIGVYDVRSSLDNFAASIAPSPYEHDAREGEFRTSTTGTQPWDSAYYTDRQLTLTGFDDIDEAIEFRIYFAAKQKGSNSVSSTSQVVRLDNVGLIGEVEAVPEPMALSTLGVAGLLLARRVRR